jgi:glutaredoxin
MTIIRTAALAALACAGLWTGASDAQVYRIVGPDGRITFSDRPPVTGQAEPAPTLPLAGGGSGTASLPYELRNAATRYPVTLYTGPECAPCATARNFLAARGVPFTERTVSTAEDVDALKKLAGRPMLPFATIGSQHLEGFSDQAWGQYLDAAGYPQTSQLPPGYRNPPPAPLVAAQPVVPRTAARPAPARQAAEAAPAPLAPPPATGSNPAGIQF